MSKQILLFVLLAGAATAGLFALAGPWSKPAVKEEVADRGTAPAPQVPLADDTKPGITLPGPGGKITQMEGVFVQAPPEYFVWEDPDNPGDTIEISSYYAWAMRAEAVEPLTRGEGDLMGALCRKVVFEAYRKPRTHVEALALARQDRGAQAALLHRRIEGEEARVFGRMVPQLLPGKSKDPKMRLGRDSEIQFSKNLTIIDADEGLEITGDEITAFPKLGTATGKKRFVMRHAAFVITGNGIKLHRITEGRALAEIGKDATLELLEDPRAADGKAILGSNEFRKARVNAEGGAIIRRDELATGERLRIEMFDHVHLEQEGGRSLDGDRVTMIAVRDVDPRARTRARSGGWRLRRLEADGGVRLKETEHKEDGRTTLFKADTERLTHDVPASGVPTTLLEGKTLLSFEGDIPLDGRERKGGLIRIMCHDRLWIGPLGDRAAPPNIPADALRRVLLEGGARIERHGLGAAVEEDVLEGDEVELVFFTEPVTGERKADALAGRSEMGRVTALEFTARGHVRLGGTRINGSTDLLVAKDLAGTRPKLSAIGKGTKLRFPEMRTNQRLVGRDKPATESTPGAATPKDEPRGAWQLRRLAAQGQVDIATSLGGPSLGVRTHMTGTRISYDDLSNLARLDGTAGNPARITADSMGSEPNTIRAQSLSMDRGRGRIVASGAVRGALWAARGGFDTGSMRGAIRRADPAPANVLEIVTDQRIDVDLVRTDPRGGVQLDSEQIVSIHGPLVAELRSEHMLIDRLRAERLDLALVLASKPRDGGGGFQLPGAKAVGSSRAGSGAAPQLAPDKLMRVEIDAAEVTVELSAGVTRRIVAAGGVRLGSDMGEATGSRIVYDGRARTVDVAGDTTRRAEVWIASEGGQRNEVTAQRFLLQLGEKSIERIQAEPRANERVVARLFSRDKTQTNELESYDIWAAGGVDIQRDALRATQVVVDRRVSKDGGRTWSAPARLWSPLLRVVGSNLLDGSSDSGRPRDVSQVIAEGPGTIIATGQGSDLVQIWGQQIVLDVKAETARVTGSPTEPVRLQKGQDGSELDGMYPEATINLKTGLPSVRGAKIVLRPGDK